MITVMIIIITTLLMWVTYLVKDNFRYGPQNDTSNYPMCQTMCLCYFSPGWAVSGLNSGNINNENTWLMSAPGQSLNVDYSLRFINPFFV